ncbi:Mini-ribonuclease 3 [Clostridium sp.]|uniref:Mini-ribonuclease 3 n=1 Tax=Clostridium sp. TaxID=1506 RepID=UPI0039F4897E
MKFDFLNSKLTTNEAKQLNPLVLAFVGDSAYEVCIRTYLVTNNRNISAHKLHLKTISFVKAHSQSEFMKSIENQLNEDELTIYKRGRNAKSGTVPKNADVQEYRIATGFEAVIGFLYLTNQLDRLNELLNVIINLNIN